MSYFKRDWRQQETQNSPENQRNKNLLIEKPFTPPLGAEMTPEELAEAERVHYVDSVLSEYFPDYDTNNLDEILRATYQRDRLNQSTVFALSMGATGIVDDIARNHGQQYYRQEDTIRVAECASKEELARFMEALMTLQRKFEQDAMTRMQEESEEDE